VIQMVRVSILGVPAHGLPEASGQALTGTAQQGPRHRLPPGPTALTRAGQQRVVRRYIRYEARGNSMPYATTNPYTGKVEKEFPTASDDEVRAAIGSADAAFRSWKDRPVSERVQVLHNAANILRERHTEYARTLTLEMGKLLTEAEAEVELCAKILEYYVKNAEAELAPRKLLRLELESAPLTSEREGVLVALARVVTVPRRDGWFIEHLVRAPDAPNGTVELLVDAVLRTARARDVAWLTLGLAPLAGEVPPLLRVARRLTPWLYDFEGLRAFKSRLRPDAWDPIYVSRPSRQGAALTVLDVLAAFTPRGLVRFGALALARGPAGVIAGLAALLVVWMALLAASSPAQWFAGHTAVKWAWVAYDALIVGGLVHLVRRPRVRTASVLLALVGVDAVLTPIEAFAWNAHRLRGALDALIFVAACLAPPFAALVLWGARSRLAASAGSHTPTDRPRPSA